MENPLSSVLQAVRGFVSGASQPERKEPGPGDVGPSVRTKRDIPGADLKINLLPLQMTAEECKEWWQRVQRARARVKAREDKWDILLNEYLPIISKSGEAETVKVQQHFRNVHSKLGQLFYRAPELLLTARDPSLLNAEMPNPMSVPGQPPLPPLKMEDIVSIKQQVLHMKMGKDGIKSDRLHDELLFDVLAWAGFGASKLGYRCDFKIIQQPVMGPDPNYNPNAMGSMLGIGTPPPQPAMVPQMGPDGKPITQSVPVPVYEEWYWRRFSPKKALWNDDLRSTRFDEDATWMGMEFFMSPRAAMKTLGLTEEEVAKATSDDRLHEYSEDGDAKSPGLVHGVEIFCKASIFTDEVHPQAMNHLILIEGIPERPVVWRPSPDQDFDPNGRLTKDSLIGFPIRILTIRDLADSPFPICDSGFTNSEIKQLSTWARQSIQIRDAAIGKYFYDTGAFDEQEVIKMKDAEIGAYIGVQSGLLAGGSDKIFCTTAQIHNTQDDYRGQQLIQANINETLGISANGAGSFTDTVRSATESANVQSNMAGRNDKELSRTTDHWLDGARMIDQLLMRYATEQDYVEITGVDGAKRIQMWNNALISGRFLYDIAPDSSLRVDTARDFELDAKHWNLVAKSPLTNQEYLLRRMARRRGLDPAKAVYPKSSIPPPPKENGKFSLALNGADLANPLVVLMLVDQGIITQEQAAFNKPVVPPPPEGAADKADVISQHVASNSGGRENAPGATNHREGQVK